ncbi:MAG: DUF1295 domain-containing protein [Nitrospira sp.]
MESENGIFASDPLPLVLTAYLFMTLVMGVLWAVQRRTRNAAIGDVGWCVGLILVVLWYATQASGGFARVFLPVMLVTLYAGRLGFHILFNRVIGKEEDARYRRLRGVGRIRVGQNARILSPPSAGRRGLFAPLSGADVESTASLRAG